MMRLSNHGKILSNIISESGMSQSEFARQLGISRQLLNQWLSKDMLNLRNLQLMNEKLKIPPRAFLNADMEG